MPVGRLKCWCHEHRPGIFWETLREGGYDAGDVGVAAGGDEDEDEDEDGEDAVGNDCDNMMKIRTLEIGIIWFMLSLLIDAVPSSSAWQGMSEQCNRNCN